jgi:glycosyltransferase involved in cell wall biosynthesis
MAGDSPYNHSMHIGIDSRLPYYQRGGISKYIRLLISSIAEIDHTNDYVIFHQRKDSDSYLPVTGSNFRPANLWTPCHHRLERWSLSAELLPHNLDVLHSPDFIPPAFGAKYKVITIHDLNFVHYPDFLTEDSRRYYLDQIAWAVAHADRISADSFHTEDDLISILNVPADKITTIHLAADPIFSDKQAKDAIASTLEQFNLPKDFILFVGTLSPRKNISNLLLAYSQLVMAESIDLPLVLAGARGWLYQELFDLVKTLDIEQNVRHIDNATDIQLSHLYSAASMLTLPSHYEGFGFPVLEAMHCGCPVICSDRASLPEVAGDAAILLDPDDIDAWSQSIESLLSDTTKQNQMIEKGYQQANNFSWNKTARETVQIYNSL